MEAYAKECAEQVLVFPAMSSPHRFALCKEFASGEFRMRALRRGRSACQESSFAWLVLVFRPRVVLLLPRLGEGQEGRHTQRSALDKC